MPSSNRRTNKYSFSIFQGISSGGDISQVKARYYSSGIPSGWLKGSSYLSVCDCWWQEKEPEESDGEDTSYDKGDVGGFRSWLHVGDCL